MQKFAKLFEDEKYGQIVVLNDENSEYLPAILVKFSAEGFGVCETAFVYKDDEEGSYEKRDAAFETFSHEDAVKVVAEIVDKITQ